MKRTTLLDRITMLREASGLTEYAFAKQIGVSPTSVYNWSNRGGESGYKVSPAKVQAIADRFGVSHAWLETGEGAWPDPRELAANQAGGREPSPGRVGAIEEAIREMEKLPVIAAYRILLDARDGGGAGTA